LRAYRAPESPPLPPHDEHDEVEWTPAAAARLASRRTWLARLTGGSLGPLARPEPAPRRDPLLTLVHRITQGFTLAEYERAKSLGFQAYLDEQLEPESIPDPEIGAAMDHYPVTQMSPKEVFDSFPVILFEATSQQKIALAARAVTSRRQLYERMCEFWLDHFNIDHKKGLEWVLLPEHERTVIRPHALGKFPELLSACAFSGAMLYYLDNWLNVRSAPQQNYARELMELHTLGVTGGYNETDVAEVSKCFTGWTLIDDPDSPDWLRARFDPALHSTGQKLVLGHRIGGTPPVGRPGHPVERNDAQAVLDILVVHPSTAHFLARKLIKRFLTSTPPQALVDDVAAAYLGTGGDIKAMLRVILTRENLAAHSDVLEPKFRRPFQYAVALLRMMEAKVNRPSGTLTHLTAMGQPPFDFTAPTGYPDDFASWGSALLPRWTFAATLIRHDFLFFGVRQIAYTDMMAKLDFAGPADRPGLAQRINERLLGETLSGFELEVLQQYIDGYPVTFGVEALYDCIVLGTTMPGYQWI
jgi:uncharacterized protein (DUF1800 family)